MKKNKPFSSTFLAIFVIPACYSSLAKIYANAVMIEFEWNVCLPKRIVWSIWRQYQPSPPIILYTHPIILMMINAFIRLNIWANVVLFLGKRTAQLMWRTIPQIWHISMELACLCVSFSGKTKQMNKMNNR